MDITFLGTGSAYPSPNRCASSLIFRNEGECWMFDCGEGTQIQLQRSIIRAGRITKVFITHLHGDHLYGLPGFLNTISFGTIEDRDPIELYGPTGLRRYVRTSMDVSRSQLNYPLIINELQITDDMLPEDWEDWQSNYDTVEPQHPSELPGRTIAKDEHGVWNIFENDNILVQAAPLKHRVPTFGYIVTEKEQPGKLDVKRLKELGVPAGPLYGQLKKGESITTSEGAVIKPEDVLGLPRAGRKIAFLWDTCDASLAAPLLQDVDVMVHEATMENEMKEKCVLNGHSTPEMAGEFARSVGAKKLVITHFSQRYKTKDSELKGDEQTTDKLLQQAKDAFQCDNVIAAEDLLTLTIPALR
ncbi:zinc phosphodiesterase ELAC protein 1-like [Anneissia japonica]|uniref:zinc phosphodiesterase ELAC protein 1-like n=1 Tax=Anneissia japonica TaxID=1529436 RepID=UPI0014259EF0|nr:zinc phosphodiesterase ELAC protein 1-like [Anneissia japonica]XP_033105872.1 zinc phosphodiesterase ELAC protein 1-like [Anneissia japonica]